MAESSGKRRGGWGGWGFKTNVDVVNEHVGTRDIYTPSSPSESIHLCQLLHCLFTAHQSEKGFVAGAGCTGFRDKRAQD